MAQADAWKEEFLQEIADKGTIETLFENTEYRIVGLPFYNHYNTTKFQEVFEEYRKKH